MNVAKQLPQDFRQVEYQPSANYGLDIEVISIDALRRRKGKDFFSTRERIDFHLLIYVTEHTCTHIVDFQPLKCVPGSLLMLQPGQMHSFDGASDWQGWLILFRPEFLLPGEAISLIPRLNAQRHLEELPQHLHLSEHDQRIVMDAIQRIRHDTCMNFNPHGLNMLLQNQLHALLNRLHMIAVGQGQDLASVPVLTQRFRRFRQTIEQHFHHWHRVSSYANHIGCSEKTLNRVVQEHAGLSAKAFLSRRIALEARRYLHNTSLPVALIADKLGFDEVTNFIKFFKREAGCSPGFFRRYQNRLSEEAESTSV